MSVTLPGDGIVVATANVGGAEQQLVQVTNAVALDVGTLAALETVNVGNLPVTQAVSGPLTDAELRANAVPMSAAALPLPAGAATQATLATVASAVYAEDTVAASGAPGVFMLAVRNDSDMSTADNGDFTALKMDEAGRLKVASQPGSYPVSTGNITASAQTVFLNVARVSNVMIHMVAAALVGHNVTFEGSIDSTNGTDGAWFGIQVVRSNANTIELVTGVLAATPAYGWEASVNGVAFIRVRATAHTSGTATWKFLPGTYATEPIPAAQISGTQPISGTGLGVVGAAAHSAAASGNPVQIGGVVATAVSTAEVAGDAARLTITTGNQVSVKSFGLPETDWQFASAAGGIINTTDVVARAAGAAGVRNYVTGASFSNNSATATEVVIKDGATVIWRGALGANAPTVPVTFPTPLRGTAATAINVACITTAAAVYANLQGYQAP